MGSIIQSVFPTIPQSTENSYHFDPRIINAWAKPRFDPEKTKNRISNEEFLYLRDKVIQNGGSSIKIARFLWFLRRLLLLVWLAIFTWRFILIFTDNSHEKSDLILQAVIYAVGILVLIILVRILGDYYAKRGTRNIKTFLNQQNTILYNRRNLNWRIHPTCVFMQLGMDEDAKGSLYVPPNTHFSSQESEFNRRKDTQKLLDDKNLS